MKGYQLSFFTIQSHRHQGKPVHQWLMQLVKEMGLRGATMIPATEGFGSHRRMHSVHFFELVDQPVEIVVAVTQGECDRLFERLEVERVHLFYVKSEVEFGTLGEAPG
jgi:PII-like signaling protein